MKQSQKDLIVIAIWFAIVISALIHFASTNVLIGVIGWLIFIRLHMIDTDIASILKSKRR